MNMFCSLYEKKFILNDKIVEFSLNLEDLQIYEKELIICKSKGLLYENSTITGISIELFQT